MAHTGFVMTGNLSSALLRFVIGGVILPKVLSTTDYANFFLFVAIMDLIGAFGDAGLNATMVRFMAMHHNEHSMPIVRRCFLMRLVLWVLVVSVAGGFASQFMRLQQVAEPYQWLYVPTIASGILLSFNAFGMTVAQGRERFGLYAYLAAHINILRLLLIAALVLAGTQNSSAYFLAFLLMPLFAVPIVTVMVFSILKETRALPRSEVSYRSLVAFAIPLGMVILITMVIQKIDVFMLKPMVSTEVLATYGLAYHIAFVFPIISRTLFTVLLPKVSRMELASDLRSYRRQVLGFYPVALGLTALGMVAGPLFIQLAFGDKYAAAVPIMRMLILGFGLHIIFNPLGTILYNVKQHHYITIIHAAQVPLLIGLNLVLIPRWQALGATWSQLLIRVLGVAVIIVLTERAIRMRERSERDPSKKAQMPVTGPPLP